MSTNAVAQLGDVATFVRGINFKPEDVVPLGTPGSVACMRTKNVQEQLDVSDVWAVAQGFVRRDEQFLRAGDVLVSSANSWNLVGKCSWVPELPWRSSFGGFVSVLRATSSRIDPRYLYWWFASRHTQALLRSFGQKTTNIANLNLKRSLRLEIPLLTLGEQRRIAETLDQADTLLKRRRNAIALLDTCESSIFSEMFAPERGKRDGWPERTLSSLVRDNDSINYGVVQPGDDFAGGVPLVRVSDLLDKRVAHDSLKRIDPEIEKTYKRSRLQGDELLVSCVGTIGLVSLASQAEKGFNIARAVARVPLGPSVERSFIAAYLRSAPVQHYFTRELRTVSQPTLNIKQLSETSVIVPPLREQKEFSRRMEGVERCMIAHRASLAQCESLFAVLEHGAFGRDH